MSIGSSRSLQSLIHPFIFQTHKDLPVQFLAGSKTLSASLVIASFGASKPYRNHVFDLKVEFDPSSPPPSFNKPLRYGKLPEIHHIFKSDPKSPPKIITLIFAAAVIAALPSLFIVVNFPGPSASRATLTLFHPSGSPWEPILITPRKLLGTPHYRMRPFFFRYWQWRGYSSCTTRLGIFFRHCPVLRLSDWSPFLAVVGLCEKSKVGDSLVCGRKDQDIYVQ